MSVFPLLLWLSCVGLVLGLRCSCDPRYCATTTCDTDGLCFISLKHNNKTDTVDKVVRCVDKKFLIPPQRPFICEYNRRQTHVYVNGCCKDSDFCADYLDVSLSKPPRKVEPPGEYDSTLLVIGLSVGFALCFVAVGAFAVVLFKRSCDGVKMQCGCCSTASYSEVASVETQSTYPGPGPSLQEYVGCSMSSGSGSGLPLLVQRSVARQVSLVKVIGQGRYGEVWMGKWRAESVAVKIFASIDEKSWFREVEIYQTVMLRHPNILGFIAADNKDNGTWTQLWLIMEYVPNGSLHDYLEARTLTAKEVARLAFSLSSGLAHLHMDIVGTHGKPAIAHRDLKSKNVLVKCNGECAIGDLGLAVRYDSKNNTIDLPEGGKVGTKRYLAPEVLDETLKENDIEAFKQADVYALGLVIWEIASRWSVSSKGEYCLPYSDMVDSDPSIEEMRKVVCTDGARPFKEEEWKTEFALSKMSSVMTECWYETPSARLSALRVKKILALTLANTEEQ